MTIAFFQPRASFTPVRVRESNLVSTVQGENQKHRAVAVFSHYRDVKVALDELDSSGFACNGLTLFARRAQGCVGYSELMIDSSFDSCRFGLNLEVQKFFSRLFRKGKYLLLINGSEHDVNTASKIISRRQNHAKVWHFE